MNKQDKVRYVLRQGQTRDHHCHWPGCGEQVPPAVWGCRRHWFMLPKSLRDEIWAAYRPGQEVNWTPSRAYLGVADRVQRWIEENHGRERVPATPGGVHPAPTPVAGVVPGGAPNATGGDTGMRRPLTQYQAHAARWRGGCGSEHCPPAAGTGMVCLARGSVPCDVLFVGEAPGESENALGRPFVGPAGKLLDEIVRRALAGFDPRPRVAFTNAVGCVPRDEVGGKLHEPDGDQLDACKPRLEEFLALARPRLIVAVGAVARDHLAQGYKHSLELPSPPPTVVSIVHPAAILRMVIAQQGFETQRAAVIIANAVEEVFG